MEQKYVLAAVLILIVAAGAIFVLYQQQEDQPQVQDYPYEFEDLPPDETDYVTPEPGSILQGCGSQETQYGKDMCWLFEASEELNAEKCKNIAEEPTKIDCIRGVAIDYMSNSSRSKALQCEESYSDNLTQLFHCLDSMLPVLTVEKLGICNQFLLGNETQLYLCKTGVAKELVDYTICETMPTNFKENCIHQVSTEDLILGKPSD